MKKKKYKKTEFIIVEVKECDQFFPCIYKKGKENPDDDNALEYSVVLQ